MAEGASWAQPRLGKLLALQVFSREASSRRGRSKRRSTLVGLLSQTLLLLCWWGSLGGWEDVSLSRVYMQVGRTTSPTRCPQQVRGASLSSDGAVEFSVQRSCMQLYPFRYGIRSVYSL